MPSHRRRVTRSAAIAGTLVLVATMTTSNASAQSTFEVVASGLDNPRHLTFSPTGDLYVVEAGRGGDGPCVEHPALGEFCIGLTGGVTHVDDDGPDRRVVDGLPSILSPDDALGPFDIAFTGSKKFVISIGLGGSDEFKAGFGEEGELLATLVSGRLDRPGVSLFADVMAHEITENPDGDDIDSNPTGAASPAAVATSSPTPAATPSSMCPTTVTSTRWPCCRTAARSAPPFLGLPPGTQIPTDPVPTSVVRGPDGALYVSQLTGFPFEPGDANIWRIDTMATSPCSPPG